MAEPSLSFLPQEILAKLRDLEFELEEGDITQKGFEKKKARLLAPFQRGPEKYRQESPRQSDEVSQSSGLRKEAIEMALAKKQSDETAGLPAPTKRQSFVTKRKTENAENRPSSSYMVPTRFTDTPTGTPVGSEEDLAPSVQTPPVQQRGSRSVVHVTDEGTRDRRERGLSNVSRTKSNEFGNRAPPPDVTIPQGDSSNFGMNTRRSVHMSSVRVKRSEVMNGSGRVSAKIQQLLNTLKRPKKKPLEQYFVEEDDQLEVSKPDPNAPKPEGTSSKPAVGEMFSLPENVPHAFTEAIRKYGSSNKAPAISVIDVNGKILYTLLYAKLLSRSQKVAFSLLNKVGSHRDGNIISQGDRVALMYSYDDPVGFISAFYGCLIAGIVPVPIDPPVKKEDAGLQHVGFFLGSCNISWVLTSESCLRNLPRDDLGHPIQFKGWPRLQFFVTENLGRPARDWHVPLLGKERKVPAYIEYSEDRDGSALGVVVSRETMIAHTQMLIQACQYDEGDTIVSALDYKRGVGLWHSVCVGVLYGMHVIYVPPSVIQQSPAMWMMMASKYKASACLVTSKELHWSLHATRDHREVNFSNLRMLLLADRANPWSLSACDTFLSAFEGKGLRPEVLCPCAYSPETLTIAIRRTSRADCGSSGRGILSLTGLSHGVVRVDKEGSITALILQDCGLVVPGAKVCVLKLDGSNELCKVDEVGELCISSRTVGDGYWGLHGKTNQVFNVRPTLENGETAPDSYVLTGLLGFLGPGGLVFVSGTSEGLMTVKGRKHNAEDIKSTVLAVDPIKFVHKGRIAVFSATILKEERIIVVAEQKGTCTEEESFLWMSHVLPAVDGIHGVGIYCLCLVAQDGLPRYSSGSISVHEAKLRFLEGSLHSVNVLMCPHTTVTNLPKPRLKVSEPGPAQTMVGNLVKGARMAFAVGREIGEKDESDLAKKYQFLSEILKWRAQSSPDHNIFTLLNAKAHVAGNLTCLQLHKRAERFAYLCIEQAKLKTGDHVALLYPPGLDLITAVLGCLYVGLIPVPIRPPNFHNVITTLPTVKMIVEVSKSVAILTTLPLIKLLRTKEAQTVVEARQWPAIIPTEDLPKKRLSPAYRPASSEMVAYLDFSVSTTGMLAGVKVSHGAVTSLCRAQKLACELYPSREIAICLDPYCGFGFTLWCLSSIYSGHHTILVPPVELESCPSLWIQAISQYRVRDTFCSYPVMELCTKHLAPHIPTMKMKGINLSFLRTCIAVAEERPRISLTQTFSALFSSLGLSQNAVSTSFGSRVNIAISMQEASHPEASSVYIDTRSLRHDRIAQVERGSPNSLCLVESGRILPGVRVVIANPETKGQCGDSSLGEIFVSSSHNGSGFFNVNDDDRLTQEHFNVYLATGDIATPYARTGYLGFIKRTDLTQTDGAPHDALFIVGSLDEALLIKGLRYHPIDIEASVTRCHKGISECAVFTWTTLLVVVVELDADEKEALDVVPLVTNVVLEDHQLIVGVVVVVDPAVIPLNSRGEKQRMHLRDSFLEDKLDPIYVAYHL
ncbi:disco-interacting protein 2-like isoform X2 [Rhopilema esculentum]|uniref:disco-interacting protein 2-like isoform X2 n=1 Tax=Rhopilema esculentum TaxID=499914 RepID=UPI0031D827A9